MNQTEEIAIDEQVERCRHGDTRSYYELYHRFAKPMLNSSMRIVNNLADAEDMVQEAFADAFKSIDRFQYKSSFEAWLRRIVINKSISMVRKKKLIMVDFETRQPMVWDDETEDDESVELELNAIKQAIRMLPDTQRIIFSLYAIDEVPQEEIARQLGLSHNNVRTIYRRTRKKILDLVKKMHHGQS